MNTLIVYASKHGATEKAAEKLSEKLNGEVDCVNLKKYIPESIDGYERVVLGTSVYAGKLHKEFVDFIGKNEEKIKEKDYAFFVCCGFEEKTETYLRENLSDDIVDGALFVKYFGQEIVWEKMKFYERAALTMVARVKKDVHDIRERDIEEAAGILNEM